MTTTWWRRGWLARWLPRRGRSSSPAGALLTQHADVVRQTVAVFARLHRLTEPETHELAAAVDSRLAEGDFAAIREYRGRSSFPNYLRVVVGVVALEHRDALWAAWRQLATSRGLAEAASTLESLVYDWATSPEEALAVVTTTGDPKPDRAALEALWAARPWRGAARTVTDARWHQPPSGPAPPGARAPTPLERELAAALRELPAEDHVLLQAHFSLRLPIEALAARHRRSPDELSQAIAALLERLRARLVSAGFAVGEIGTLLRNPPPGSPREGETGRSGPSNQVEMPDDPSNGD